jgi:Peptidase family M23
MLTLTSGATALVQYVDFEGHANLMTQAVLAFPAGTSIDPAAKLWFATRGGMVVGGGPLAAGSLAVDAAHGRATIHQGDFMGEPFAYAILQIDYLPTPTTRQHCMFWWTIAPDTHTTSSMPEGLPVARATLPPIAFASALGLGTPLAGAPVDTRVAFIGVREPVDIVDVITQAPASSSQSTLLVKRTVIVEGQIVNWYADATIAAQVSKVLVMVRDSITNEVVLHSPTVDFWRDPTGKMRADFWAPMEVPATFDAGTVEIVVPAPTGEIPLGHRLVAFAPPTLPALHSAFDQTLTMANSGLAAHCGNGSAADYHNEHNGDVPQHYAYDLGFWRNHDAFRPGTARGDHDAWAFGQPVHCLADGVAFFVDSSNADSSSATINRIRVRHPHVNGDRFSVYAHIQQNSARVTQGQAVVAGQVLGLAGSSGTGESHLHVAYYEFDEYGHLRTLPIPQPVQAPVQPLPSTGIGPTTTPTPITYVGVLRDDLLYLPARRR